MKNVDAIKQEEIELEEKIVFEKTFKNLEEFSTKWWILGISSSLRLEKTLVVVPDLLVLGGCDSV